MPRGLWDYTLKWFWDFDWSRRVTWLRTGGLVLSHWTERFAAVVVRNVSSLQMKKAKIVWKQVDGWVGIAGAGSCLEGCPYGWEQITCRWIKGVVDECRQSCVYRSSWKMRFWAYIDLCRRSGTKSVLMKFILMTDKIVVGIQIVIWKFSKRGVCVVVGFWLWLC